MPVSVCIEAGCPNFAEVRGRCKAHYSDTNRELKARTAGAKLYNSKRWRTLRRKVLARDRYTCQECKRFGNEVDHVTPISDGGAEWSQSNLQTLCKPCHTRKTGRETRTYG